MPHYQVKYSSENGHFITNGVSPRGLYLSQSSDNHLLKGQSYLQGIAEELNYAQECRAKEPNNFEQLKAMTDDELNDMVRRSDPALDFSYNWTHRAEMYYKHLRPNMMAKGYAIDVAHDKDATKGMLFRGKDFNYCVKIAYDSPEHPLPRLYVILFLLSIELEK